MTALGHGSIPRPGRESVRLPSVRVGRTVAVCALMAASFGADLCGHYVFAVLLLVVACGETFYRPRGAR